MARLELFDPALLEHVPEQEAYNRSIMEATGAMNGLDAASPEGLAWVRAAMEPGGLFGMKAYDFPEVREIPGPAGPIPIRILVPETVRGVYLHLHGGGMTVGSATAMDGRNWEYAQACDLAVVSVDYRLAPEDPFPAGPDDCEAAATWLVEHAVAELGTDRLIIGGESAGAYLALLTLLRLRDRDGSSAAFLGADLCYGGYDMSGTPSRQELAGKVPYATGDDANRRLYLGARTDAEVPRPGDLAPVGRAPRPAAVPGHGGHVRLAPRRQPVPGRPVGGSGQRRRPGGVAVGPARHRAVTDGPRPPGPPAHLRVPDPLPRRGPDHGGDPMSFEPGEVREAYDNFVKVGDSGDWSAWADLHTVHGLWVEHHLGRFEGREAIREAITSVMAQAPSTMAFPVEWVVIDGTRVVYYPWQVLPDPTGGDEVYRFGCVTILEYAGDGQFSYQEDVYNPTEGEKVFGAWIGAGGVLPSRA